MPAATKTVLYKDFDLSFRAHPKTGNLLMKKNNDSPVGNKRQSSQARAASNNGMSMDNHASVTMASEFRRQISESESHT